MKELNEATVLAVGPGALDREGKRMPMGVKEGDKVLIPQVGDQRMDTIDPGKSTHIVARSIDIIIFTSNPLRAMRPSMTDRLSRSLRLADHPG